MSLVQRVPELEATPEPQYALETLSEKRGNGRGSLGYTERERPGSWWRRLFS